jgi:hypothetical protein
MQHVADTISRVGSEARAVTVHRSTSRFSIILLLVLVLVAFATVSSADPVTVRFMVFPDASDPINLAPLNASFTFDSSLIPAQGGIVEDRTGQLASAISPFTWGNTLWTTANASVWSLSFDANGGLTDFNLGGAPSGFDAVAFVGADDFVIRVPISGYTLAAVPGERLFNARTFSPDLVTPEPGTLLLLTSGVAALVARRKSIVRRSTPAPLRG